MGKFESTMGDLRDTLDACETLSIEDRKKIDVDVDAIEAIHNRVVEERDQAQTEADAAPDEDDVRGGAHDKLARELEPLFGAIYRGDMVAARAVLGNLPPVLDGSDPILIALQRAKSRPHLYLAPAA